MIFHAQNAPSFIRCSKLHLRPTVEGEREREREREIWIILGLGRPPATCIVVVVVVRRPLRPGGGASAFKIEDSFEKLAQMLVKR